jgi:hypothetical protein
MIRVEAKPQHVTYVVSNYKIKAHDNETKRFTSMQKHYSRIGLIKKKKEKNILERH